MGYDEPVDYMELMKLMNAFVVSFLDAGFWNVLHKKFRHLEAFCAGARR